MTVTRFLHRLPDDVIIADILSKLKFVDIVNLRRVSKGACLLADEVLRLQFRKKFPEALFELKKLKYLKENVIVYGNLGEIGEKIIHIIRDFTTTVTPDSFEELTVTFPFQQITRPLLHELLIDAPLEGALRSKIQLLTNNYTTSPPPKRSVKNRSFTIVPSNLEELPTVNAVLSATSPSRTFSFNNNRQLKSNMHLELILPSDMDNVFTTINTINSFIHQMFQRLNLEVASWPNKPLIDRLQESSLGYVRNISNQKIIDKTLIFTKVCITLYLFKLLDKAIEHQVRTFFPEEN